MRPGEMHQALSNKRSTAFCALFLYKNRFIKKYINTVEIAFSEIFFIVKNNSIPFSSIL
jgi:hypothetical protein